MGRKAGVSEAKLRALVDFESSPELTEIEKLVLRYSTHMTATPVEIPDELFAELQKHFDQPATGRADRGDRVGELSGPLQSRDGNRVRGVFKRRVLSAAGVESSLN